MKKFILLNLTLFIIFSCGKTDVEILEETISQLSSLKQIEYDVINENVSEKYNINRKDSATCYFDFSSNDTLIGAKYHFISSHGEQVFNGKMEFSSIPKEEVLLYNEQPVKRQVISSIFMQGSFFALRKVLPEILQDSTITIIRSQDTIIQDKNCYQFHFSMQGKYIGLGGELTILDDKTIDPIPYELFISKKTKLPVRFGNRQPNNAGYNISTYSNYKALNAKNDSIWSYSRFPKNYLRSSYKDYFDGLRQKNKKWIDTEAPDWELSDLEGNSVKLSGIKENLVLLEFWFPYCGGCVQATPVLNEIQKKYKDRGLSIYGIEFTNKSAESLMEYAEEQQVEIPTLYHGKNISKDYGIYAAPTFFLIDNKGKIVYTSVGLNKEKLINKIEENI